MSKIWTSLPVSSGKCSIIRKLTQGITFMFCAFSLSACGPVSSFFDKSEKSASASVRAPENGDAQRTTLKEGEAGIVPLSPPGASVTPLMPGQSGTQYTAEGLPVLQPSYGVNVEQLFAQDIRDPIERVKRVENAVIDIRKELNAITPSIVRLVAVEKDIQNLVEQLEVLLQNEPQSTNTEPAAQSDRSMQAPVPLSTSGGGQGLPETGTPSRGGMTAQQANAPPQAEETPPSSQTRTTTPPASSSATAVREVRIGEHKDKTRLVMDVSGKTAFRYDLDKLENLLVIELDDAGWNAARNWTAQKAPLIASYNVQDMQNGGSRMIIQLKHSAEIVHSGTIAPNKDSRNHRVVIDLSAPAVHGR